MWVFDAPGFLALFLFVPVMVYLRHFWPARGGQVALPIQLWQGISFRPSVWSVRLLYVLAVVSFWAGVVFLLLALAGPSQVRRERVFLTPGIDVMFVLDESPTMSARDFAPVNRFEAAREVIRGFVQQRDNDAIGLVGFAREAALRVPPTVDHAALIEGLDRARIMELGDGTAIGNALAVAVLHLETSSAPDRVIILLTDGINNAGEILPETAARVAAQVGIRVYTIGIGTGQETTLEFEAPDTGRLFRGIFDGGYDEPLLRQIAEITGGAYFHAGSAGTLKAILQSIDTVETVERRVRIEVRRRPLYREWMAIGLALLLFDFLIRKWFLREVL